MLFPCFYTSYAWYKRKNEIDTLKIIISDDKLAYNGDLIAEGDMTQVKTKYRIIKLKDVMDIDGFKQFIKQNSP